MACLGFRHAIFLTGLLFANCSHSNSLKYDALSQVAIGRGIIAPYKILEAPGTNGKSVFVLTGLGESFGTSKLHYVDANTLKNKKVPLALCSDASAMTLIGFDYVVVACRSSQEIVEVDIKAWKITASYKLGFAPIDVVKVQSDEIFVSSVNTGDIALFGVNDHSIKLHRHSLLRKNSYGAVYDSKNKMIYVVQPTLGVVEVNSNTLSIVRTYVIKGTPSYGIALWNEKVLLTDRDGYLYVLQPYNGKIRRIDLAELLGLVRQKLPLRGIEPTDVLSIDRTKILVIDNRQNSLIISLKDEEPFAAKVIKQLPSGAYGAYDSEIGQAYITEPTSNKITTVSIHECQQTNICVTAEGHVVGEQITYYAKIPNRINSTILAITSMNKLVQVSGENPYFAQQINIPGVVPIGPIVGGQNGEIYFIGNYRSVHSVICISEGGRLLYHVDTGNFWPIFSMRYNYGRLLLVGRLQNRLGILSPDSGNLLTFNSIRTRPRTGLLLKNDMMIVIHDTAPDHGYSLWKADHIWKYIDTSRNIRSYPTDIKSFDDNRTAIISYFDGDLIQINLATGNIMSKLTLPGMHPTSLGTCNQGEVWATSINDDKAYGLDYSTRNVRIVTDITLPGLQSITPVDIGKQCTENHDPLLWAITDTSIETLQLAPHK